ncbi:MAG: GNAT family protein [Anaerolineales bacterium]
MVHVRAFAVGDGEGLARAIDAVCAEGQWMRTARFEPDAAWEHALAYPDCPCRLLLVAEDGGDIVGWCRAFPADAGEAAVTIGLGLLPSHRDQGIGTAMLRQALDWARRVGYRQARLTTREDNARAIHVFQRCGFRVAGPADDGLLSMTCDLVDLGFPEQGGRS